MDTIKKLEVFTVFFYPVHPAILLFFQKTVLMLNHLGSVIVG